MIQARGQLVELWCDGCLEEFSGGCIYGGDDKGQLFRDARSLGWLISNLPDAPWRHYCPECLNGKG